MPLLEDIKKTAEHLTGWQRPEPAQLDKLVRKSKANAPSSRMTASSRIIRVGRSSSTVALSVFLAISIPLPC